MAEIVHHKRGRPHKHTETEIREGLTELAMCAGGSHKAAENLKERGMDIPSRTLREWRRTTHRDVYEDIRTDVIDKIHARIAADQEDIAVAASELELKLMHQLDAQRETLAPRDIATALRNVSTTKGIAVDKFLPMRNKATVIHQLQADDILAKIERLVPKAVITVEGEAEEVPDEPAELPAELPA